MSISGNWARADAWVAGLLGIEFDQASKMRYLPDGQSHAVVYAEPIDEKTQNLGGFAIIVGPDLTALVVPSARSIEQALQEFAQGARSASAVLRRSARSMRKRTASLAAGSQLS